MRIYYCRESGPGEDLTRISDILLKKVLTEQEGLGDDIEVVRPEHQKPYILNHDLQFSVSHTAGMWMCAVSDLPVGIDVELADRVVRYPEQLAKRFMSEAEAELVISDKNVSKKFIEVWTQREAVYKMTGTGLMSCKETGYDTISLPEGAAFKTYYSGGYVFTICEGNSSDNNREIIEVTDISEYHR